VTFKHPYEQSPRRLSAFGSGSDAFFDSINKKNNLYVTSQGSQSVTNLVTAANYSRGLKRSNTTPSKRAESKEHEPLQAMFVNDINVNRSLTSCKLYI
jgi:hypothetical protein